MDYWSWYRGVDTSTFMGSLELAGKDGYEAGWKACALSKMKEIQEKGDRINELEFMIKNGLGWDDMKSDGANGEGADR